MTVIHAVIGALVTISKDLHQSIDKIDPTSTIEPYKRPVFLEQQEP